nr:Gag-Pol polyprotein [Tanacetum cinerariifolium]
MKTILRKDKCLAAIGERPDEVMDDCKWDEMDGKVIANLHLALAEGVLSSIEEKKSAVEIWDHLARLRNKREDRQTSSRHVEALVVTRGRSMELAPVGVTIMGNVTSTSKDSNALCCEAAIKNKGMKRFADVCCNDHELKILGIGSIMVKMHDGTVHTIQDVQYVEGMKKNLLSLGKLDDLGCKLMGEIIEEAKALVASHSLSHRVVVTWHQKIGQMYEKGMKILVERKLLPGLIKVYQIKKKSDVFEVLKVYKARVKLDYGNKIKCLRMDNGGEYTGDEFDTYYRQEEIKKAVHDDINSLAEWMYNSQETRKLDLKSRKCLFLGYDDGVKGYRLWDHTAYKVVFSRDIVFMEDKIQENEEGDSTTRKTTSIQMEKEFQLNDFFEVAPQHEVNETNESQAPATVLLIMKENVQGGTQIIGRKPTRNKWVYKIKKIGDDQVKRYRARLVVKGYAQKDGIDFNEIFSPMVRMTSIRVVLEMYTMYDLHLEQLDAPRCCEEEKMSRVPYASALGSLMFAMICTRPDITHAVGVELQDKNDTSDADEPPGSSSQPASWGFVLTRMLLDFAFKLSVWIVLGCRILRTRVKLDFFVLSFAFLYLATIKLENTL